MRYLAHRVVEPTMFFVYMDGIVIEDLDALDVSRMRQCNARWTDHIIQMSPLLKLVLEMFYFIRYPHHIRSKVDYNSLNWC